MHLLIEILHLVESALVAVRVVHERRGCLVVCAVHLALQLVRVVTGLVEPRALSLVLAFVVVEYFGPCLHVHQIRLVLASDNVVVWFLEIQVLQYTTSMQLMLTILKFYLILWAMMDRITALNQQQFTGELLGSNHVERAIKIMF